MSSVLDEVLEGFEPSPQIVSVMAASRPAAILGIDIGTSGVRASLFDELGNELEGALRSLQRSASDVASLNAEDSVELVALTIDAVLAGSPLAFTQIDLISVSCFWHSLVGIDEHLRPTTPVFTWVHTEATEAAQQLRNSFSEREIHNRTGCRFHPSYWPAKLLWLKQEQAARFQATTTWLSFGEFLVLRFFGKTNASISMASATGLFNQKLGAWDTETIDALGIHPETLPNFAAPRASVQGLTEEYSSRWPQLANATILPAVGDGAAITIGSGCTSKVNLALTVGSSAAMRVLYRGEPPAQLPPELWCYRVDDERIISGGALSDGGKSLWLVARVAFSG